MDSQAIIGQYKNAIIQIATPVGTGTGFFVKEFNLIVTNEHVISNNYEVTITGKNFEKAFAKVCYTDKRHDLAFIEAPAGAELPEIRLGNYNDMRDGDHVVAIGHPYGLNYTATQGVISKVDRIREGLKFIQIDAAINPGNSGGPLVNNKGEVIGVNSFIIQGGDNLGFALPVSYLKEALLLYQPFRGQTAARCFSCNYIVTATTLDSGKYCGSCGTEVTLLAPPEKEIEPAGTAKLIEDILSDLGKHVRLAREGLNHWAVKEGSAKIRITFNPQHLLVAGDAYLCHMPTDVAQIRALYQYLLEENYRMSGLVLSCVKQDIVLSFIIHEHDLSREGGVLLFRNLFQKADEYDDYLKKTFGCFERIEE